MKKNAAQDWLRPWLVPCAHPSSIWALPYPEKEEPRPRAAADGKKLNKDISPPLDGCARESGKSIFPILLKDVEVIPLTLQ